ncbi:MAG: serine/threonine-protein kinase, partial [Planctomycetota bacterium]
MTRAYSRDSETDDFVDDLVEAWWSSYCPTCGARQPLDATTCPHDGTRLRSLSVFANDTRNFSGEELSGSPPACPSCGRVFQAGVAFCPHDGTRIPDAEPADEALPDSLGAKWMVEERRGGGAFGSFYLGAHGVLGMKVGIKVLKHRYTETEERRRQFHQEAMRLSLLHHPNIVQVLDYGEEQTIPYLVMEYLDGEPLHRSLVSGSLRLDEAVEVCRQAGLALVAAHEGGAQGDPLVHLDLKPEHIFIHRLEAEIRVKVIDFGIAEIVSRNVETSRSERIAGTLPYMAPERWDGIVDPRCDIYSLGAVLYELVAGRPPHDEAPRGRTARAKLRAPSRLRGARTERHLRKLDEIILRAVAEDPSARYSDARSFVRALEQWQALPRLRLRQRVARAAIVPVVMLVVLTALAIWAPWEQLVFSSDEVVRVGPNRAS